MTVMLTVVLTLTVLRMKSHGRTAAKPRGNFDQSGHRLAAELEHLLRGLIVEVGQCVGIARRIPIHWVGISWLCRNIIFSGHKLQHIALQARGRISAGACAHGHGQLGRQRRVTTSVTITAWQ